MEITQIILSASISASLLVFTISLTTFIDEKTQKQKLKNKLYWKILNTK